MKKQQLKCENERCCDGEAKCKGEVLPCAIYSTQKCRTPGVVWYRNLCAIGRDDETDDYSVAMPYDFERNGENFKPPFAV